MIWYQRGTHLSMLLTMIGFTGIMACSADVNLGSLPETGTSGLEETSNTIVTSGGDPVPVCGDGNLLIDVETCDDGNLVDGDGCSAKCEGPPAAVVLKLNFSQIKQFEFSWEATGGASFYQLLERPTEDAPYAKLGGDIVGESISLTMPLHLRFGAGYILRACNAGGCTDSVPVAVVDSIASAIGYFKASNTGAVDYFGAVALSADGNTLAVGARLEDSEAIGIDGDQANDAAKDTGAVYVFHRVNDTWSQQAYIKASNTGTIDQFGGNLALSANGDTLVVGARLEDSDATGVGGDQASNDALDSGAVYVFVRANDAWS